MNKIIALIASLSLAMPVTAAIALIQSPLPEATANPLIVTGTPLLLARHKNTRSIPPAGQNADWGEIRVPDDLSSYEPLTFTQSLEFQVMVHDPQVGDRDGAGIENVDIQIQDSDGNIVYKHTEKRAGYCPFGRGEPDCNVFVFAKNGYLWPQGKAITSGDYKAITVINQKNGKGNFQWTFDFKIQLPDR
jgi:hypothetical protein